jgi:hypothetical protein
MSSPNLVVVEIDGAEPVNVTSIVGLTEAIVVDWGSIDPSSSASTDEAMVAIAKLKVQLFPWREQLGRVWTDLLERENDWLEGAASDANLTYNWGAK